MPITRPTLTKLAELGVRDGSSPRESFAPDNSTVTAEFHVNWSERLNAVVYFLGYAQLATSSSPTAVTRLERLTPMPHPDVPGSMFATTCPDSPHHKWAGKRSSLDGAARNTFEMTKLRVGYEHVPFVVAEDSEVTATQEWRRFVYPKAVEPKVEPLNLPTGAFEYATEDGAAPDGLAIPYGKTINLQLTRFTLCWASLPAAMYSFGTDPIAWQKRVWGWPAEDIKPLIGRVNSHDWLAWPAGTLLLENVVPIVRRHPTIGRAWDFDVILVHNPVGWLNAYYLDRTSTSGASRSGWYQAVSAPNQYFDVPDMPDDRGLYNVGRVERVFDPTG